MNDLPIKLYKKLLEFQEKIEAIKKDKKNPFFNSYYSDIDGLLSVVKPKLGKLLVLQPVIYLDGNSFINTQIIDSESGEKIESNTLIKDYEIIPNPAYKPDKKSLSKRVFEINWLQKFGAAVTYTRKIALVGILGLEQTEEEGAEDGNSPNQVSKSKPQPEVTGEVIHFVVLKAKSFSHKQYGESVAVRLKIDGSDELITSYLSLAEEKKWILSTFEKCIGVTGLKFKPENAIGKDGIFTYKQAKNGKSYPNFLASTQTQPPVQEEEDKFDDDIPF